MDIQELWSEFLERGKKLWSKENFETWILPLKPKLDENNILFLNCKNSFTRDWLKSRYYIDLRQLIHLIDPSISDVIMQIDNEAEETEHPVLQQLDRIEDKLDLLYKIFSERFL